MLCQKVHFSRPKFPERLLRLAGRASCSGRAQGCNVDGARWDAPALSERSPVRAVPHCSRYLYRRFKRAPRRRKSASFGRESKIVFLTIDEDPDFVKASMGAHGCDSVLKFAVDTHRLLANPGSASPAVCLLSPFLVTRAKNTLSEYLCFALQRVLLRTKYMAIAHCREGPNETHLSLLTRLQSDPCTVSYDSYLPSGCILRCSGEEWPKVNRSVLRQVVPYQPPFGERRKSMWLRKLESLLLIFGLLMLTVYVGARIQSAVLSKLAVQQFGRQRVPHQDSAIATGLAPSTPDFSLWSTSRMKEYQESLAAHFSPAVAVLRLPKIRLEVPVLEGTDDLSLNRAVGLIAGTARPGDGGNVGIAGHRDGFFRRLKDVDVGDKIELVTATRTETYVIDRIVIVDPDNVSVLAAGERPSITLVTCFPFYFVGTATRRYIVHARLLDAIPNSANPSRSETSIRNAKAQ